MKRKTDSGCDLRGMMDDQKLAVIGLLVGSEQQGTQAVGGDIVDETSDDAEMAARLETD